MINSSLNPVGSIRDVAGKLSGGPRRPPYKEPSTEHSPFLVSHPPLSALSQILFLFKAALDVLFNLVSSIGRYSWTWISSHLSLYWWICLKIFLIKKFLKVYIHMNCTKHILPKDDSNITWLYTWAMNLRNDLSNFYNVRVTGRVSDVTNMNKVWALFMDLACILCEAHQPCQYVEVAVCQSCCRWCFQPNHDLAAVIIQLTRPCTQYWCQIPSSRQALPPTKADDHGNR